MYSSICVFLFGFICTSPKISVIWKNAKSWKAENVYTTIYLPRSSGILQTRKHSGRSRTTRLPTVHVLVAATRYHSPLGYLLPHPPWVLNLPPPNGQRHPWKHYLPATSFVDGNRTSRCNTGMWFLGSISQSPLGLRLWLTTSILWLELHWLASA